MLATVNVIDCRDADNMDFASLQSFPDTEEGNKLAEETFREWVKQVSDVPPTNDEIENAVKVGYFTVGEGYIAIIHSSIARKP